ncbi:hypothetical protein U8326_15490 [Tsuneonella sp. CC-YZS046]|uniref:hypothetical protein n=1 Tax=Tsuneonella sp. CC-YZS046 TaxID=3042152 RepID=UPI002D79184D|nr:hypothetical protein [Tsuneonella sp. CC-YZS046]WRO66418.1 hypothetical protein U8326_15490 [Tsuneonella sp. CC-YZS046]
MAPNKIPLVEAATMIGNTREAMSCMISSCLQCPKDIVPVFLLSYCAAQHISQSQKSSGALRYLQLAINPSLSDGLPPD